MFIIESKIINEFSAKINSSLINYSSFKNDLISLLLIIKYVQVIKILKFYVVINDRLNSYTITLTYMYINGCYRLRVNNVTKHQLIFASELIKFL